MSKLPSKYRRRNSMYISKLKIKNFRIFNDQEIEFNEKLNVIIGPNNSGKSTLITALQILFDKSKRKRLETGDFNRNIDLDKLKNIPPKISITAIISNDGKKFSEEMIPVATWLTEISDNYEARLTYEFFLPDKYEGEYQDKFKKYEINNDSDYWEFLEKEFIKKYVHKFYGGHEEYKNTVDWDDLAKFDFQFLSAIRDVEKDLSTGKKSLLKEVLEFFTDYDLKENKELDETEKTLEINERIKEFSKQSTLLLNLLEKRMETGKSKILEYVENTGVSADDIKPDFIGKISENEMYSHMFLIVDNENNVQLPIELNGLGYNNLLYISLILAKIQKDSNVKYLGDNAKAYSILAIEEPEAHLHPNMQYKFLKFLKENQEKEVKQVFITSHSPNITSTVELDNLIILDKLNNDIQVYYPYKTFKDDDENLKKYIERFLDVTKSDMFFAKKVIFVEGLAEQLLLPLFAKQEKFDLFDHHVSIVNVNGKYFEPFLKLFDYENGGINKQVACITDCDCQKKKKSTNSRWKGCYIYELNLDEDNYEYNRCSTALVKEFKDKKNINIKIQKNSHTFEYELILENIDCKEILTESLPKLENIMELMEIYKDSNEDYDNIFNKLECPNKDKLQKRIIHNNDLTPKEKSKHIIATRYMKSIENKKGICAQELSNVLNGNIENHTFDFKVPEYICEVIEWLKK